jgi:hypothetical protein
LKEEQTIRRDRSRTVSVQELQARLTALLFPASGNRDQAVPLTSRGKVVMVLVPWYHFQGQVRMDVSRGNLPLITRTIPCTEARKRSTALHEQLLQLAQANGEALVALVILRHQEQLGALMLWDNYELVYNNASSVLLGSGAVTAAPPPISALTIVQARNRLLRLPEDFAAGVLTTPLVITKRTNRGKNTVDRPVLLIIPYPEFESG